MNAFFVSFVPTIIGQTPPPTLAALRTPLFLPDSISEFLFHASWAYYLPLFLAGLALAYWGGPKIRRFGLPVAVLALIWFLLGALFITPRERLWNAHAAILAAAEHHDPQPIKDLLAPNFTFGAANRSTMSDQIDHFFNEAKIKSNTLRAFKIELNYPAAETQINIITMLEGQYPGPHLTKWLLEWTDTPGSDWQLTAIRRWYYGDQEMPPSLPSAP